MKTATWKGLVVANFIIGFSMQGLAQEPDIANWNISGVAQPAMALTGRERDRSPRNLKQSPPI